MKNNVFALSALFLLILSTGVFAQDFDWTTTADFDNSKSASSGNYEVETITDNGRNTANEIILANMLGDNMNYSDADGLTWKWADDPISTALTPYTRNIDTTVNDVYYIQVAPTTSGQYGGRYSKSNVNFSGNFDVRINVDHSSSASGNNVVQFRFAVASDKYAYLTLRKPATGYMTITAGTQEGATAYSNIYTLSSGDDRAVSFRINRTGEAVSLSYDLAGGDSWTILLTTSTWVSDSGYIFFGLYRGVATGTHTSHWYNYKETTLTTLTNAFRSSGNFITGDYALGTDYLESLTIEHNGLSANRYIDKIEILLDGAVEYTNTTDIITGSSTTFTHSNFTDITGGDLGVRVYLAGDGAGSPVVSRIYGYAINPPNAQNATFFNMVLEWNDDVGVDYVAVEGDWSGTPTNYTMLNTFGGSWYNYALNVSEVPSGDYYWMSWANNTNDEWEHSDRYNFTIQGSDIDYMRIIKILIALEMIDIDNDIITIDETHDLIIIKN